jgi:tetraacyldisaccharide 4'-kinase
VLRAALARVLERGDLDGPVAEALGHVWSWRAERSLARALGSDARARIVAVGGATLGGSGKTPLAIACAAHLAARGVRVVLVGHGYRARAAHARVVSGDDAIDEVGDEALLAVRTLPPPARVVIGPTRAAALALAASIGDVFVLDGVAQTAPSRAALALLAVDAREPWGRARATPPRGDLVAPARALVDACDAVVTVGASRDDSVPELPGPRPVWRAVATSRGAYLREENHTGSAHLLTWAELRSRRVGFLSALGRPYRVLASLAAHGTEPVARVEAADHGPLGSWAAQACRAAARRQGVELWLTTPKCALHAERAGGRRALGAPVATLDYSIALAPVLCARLEGLVAS